MFLSYISFNSASLHGRSSSHGAGGQGNYSEYFPSAPRLGLSLIFTTGAFFFFYLRRSAVSEKKKYRRHLIASRLPIPLSAVCRRMESRRENSGPVDWPPKERCSKENWRGAPLFFSLLRSSCLLASQFLYFVAYLSSQDPFSSCNSSY